jgi:hypothetical protein
VPTSLEEVGSGLREFRPRSIGQEELRGCSGNFVPGRHGEMGPGMGKWWYSVGPTPRWNMYYPRDWPFPFFCIGLISEMHPRTVSAPLNSSGKRVKGQDLVQRRSCMGLHRLGDSVPGVIYARFGGPEPIRFVPTEAAQNPSTITDISRKRHHPSWFVGCSDETKEGCKLGREISMAFTPSLFCASAKSVSIEVVGHHTQISSGYRR